MPFEYSWEERGFYCRFWGEVPEWEIKAKNVNFSNDPRCDDCLYQILDGTDIDAFILPAQGITKIASNDIGMCAYLKSLSVVLVGTKPEVRDVFQQYVSTCLRMNITWKFHICETLEQARKWLKQQEKVRSREKNPNANSKLENRT
ncbi:hypothetical protein VDG1235_3107 [Verrucomicrobiia bacterium DG1235]|nr:hypothetical protein VDG1235_3107 [Verrucomicrobiae bacterium DG1235]